MSSSSSVDYPIPTAFRRDAGHFGRELPSRELQRSIHSLELLRCSRRQSIAVEIASRPPMACSTSVRPSDTRHPARDGFSAITASKAPSDAIAVAVGDHERRKEF